MENRIVKVLVVEDSPVVRELLVRILDADPGIRVIGTVNSGEKAVAFLNSNKPDAITMDFHLPKMNGFDATRKIMETNPTPVIIVTGSADPKEVSTTFRALEAGALVVLARPPGIGHPEHIRAAKELTQTVKLMSEVKVIRRWARAREAKARPGVSGVEAKKARRIDVVAIGASTGGPLVLQTILSGLPRDFPVPVLIVQHMAAGFVHGFVEWLGQSSGMPMRVAANGERILPGHVYVAPDNHHMRVTSNDSILLSGDQPQNGLRPSVSCLLSSVIDVYGANAAGILLTGMGKDGVRELKRLREIGGVTIVQDAGSAVVNGMPGEAVKCGAATHVLPPGYIAAALTSMTKKHEHSFD